MITRQIFTKNFKSLNVPELELKWKLSFLAEIFNATLCGVSGAGLVEVLRMIFQNR